MDDFVIGAASVDNGQRIIARLQRGLEPLGLYPNTAKTRVVSNEVFLREVMAEENAWIERAESELKRLEHGELRQVEASTDLVEELTERFEAHRALEDRPKRWDRVLRRYYVLLRRAGVGEFIDDALSDLRALPDSAPHLLEYVRSFPLTPGAARVLVETAVDLADLYGNVPLLALETISTSPNTLDADGSASIARTAFQLVVDGLSNSTRVERDLLDRMLASTIPIIAKFGDESLCVEATETITATCEPKSHARIQAAVVGLGLGTPDRHLFGQALPGLRWDDVLALRYLDALDQGDNSAVGVGLGLLQPQIRLLPNRYHLHARPLMLIPVLHRVAGEKLTRQATTAARQLSRNPERLRDHRTERLLLREGPDGHTHLMEADPAPRDH